MPTIFVEILGNATQFKRELDRAVVSTAKANSGMSKMGKIAGVAGLAIAGGIAFGLGKAVSAAGDFESQLNTLQAVSGTTNAEMKELSKQAIALGADIKLPGTSALDASQAMTELIKAGVSVKNTQSGVRSVLVLSAAAHIGNAQAAEIGANAMNAFGLRGKQMTKVVDQLANTANKSSVEIVDVADAFKNAAAVFKGFQGPVVGSVGAMSELNTTIGILGNAGIKGGEAGTTLKQVLLKLGAPTARASDTMRALYASTVGAGKGQDLLTAAITGTTKKIRDEAINAYEDLNKTTGKQGDIAYDASGKMRPLKDIIRLTTAATKDMSQQDRNAALNQIFGAKAIRGAIILMRSQSDEAKKLGQDWDSMAKAVDKNGSAQELASAKMKGYKGAQQALQSSMETLQITIGLKLLPVMTVLTNFLAVELPVAVATLSSLLDNNRTTFEVLGFTVGVVLAGLLAYKIGVVAAGVATKLWAVATNIQTAAQWLLNAAMTANPVGLIIVGVAALAAGLVILYTRSETARDVINAVWKAIRDVARPIIDWFTDTGLPALGTAFHVVGAAINVAVGLIKGYVTVGFDIVKGVINVIKDLLDGDFSKAWKDIKDTIGKVFDDIDKALGGLPGKLLGFAKTIGSSAVKVGEAIVTGILNGLGGLLQALIDAVTAAVGDALQSAKDFLTGGSGPKAGAGRYTAPPPKKMALGGIVTRPTYALIGEAGPEAVIPLSRGGLGGTGGGGDVYVTVQGWVGNDQDIAEKIRNTLIRTGRNTTGGALGRFA